MKPIKFDLPLNGIRIATLEQLEENLTPEILEPFRSGKLAKWLRVRNLTEQAEAVETLLSADVEDEVQLFKSLCEVFVSEVDENDAREAIEEYNNVYKNAATEELITEQDIEFTEENGYEEQFDNSGYTNEAQQIKLLEEGDENQRIEIASCPNLSEKVQNKLLYDRADSVLVALACNPSLLEEVQARLAAIGSPKVREALAANPILSSTQQNYLAMTGNNGVKLHLASNPSLGATEQAILVKEDTWTIRAALAANPSVSIDCQSLLMKDNDADVKIALAGNPALSHDIQQQMADSSKDRVLESLAQNPSLSNALMEKFERMNSWSIVNALAANKGLPEYLQARLISNSGSSVRKTLANNPCLKTAQQAELINVGDAETRLDLLENPSLDELLKPRLMASFNQNDLNSMEGSLEFLERRLKAVSEKYDKAKKKSNSLFTDIFSDIQGLVGVDYSDTRGNRLHEDSQRISNDQDEAENEVFILKRKVRKLKDILGCN